MATDTQDRPVVTGNGEGLHESNSIHVTIVHNRNRYSLNFNPDTTVREMKLQLETMTNVSVDMQKLIFQGILQDDTVLANLQLPSRDAKIMLIGSERSVAEKVIKRASSSTTDVAEGDGASGVTRISGEDGWCSSQEHLHVLTVFGKPDDASVGLTNTTETLDDDIPLVGMCDKRGNALRLRFKVSGASVPSIMPPSPPKGGLPLITSGRELWLTTSSATHKIPLEIIQAVESQPITNHPEYHIMAFQLGPTMKSRFFVYWVPAQFVESIKTKALQIRGAMMDPVKKTREQ